jgi:hypothetical protein
MQTGEEEMEKAMINRFRPAIASPAGGHAML